MWLYKQLSLNTRRPIKKKFKYKKKLVMERFPYKEWGTKTYQMKKKPIESNQFLTNRESPIWVDLKISNDS